jgi:hypothetical protein
MTSRQIKKALPLRLFAICVVLLLAGFPAKASEVISPQDNLPSQPRVVLEVILTCNGMCGEARVSRFRLLDDATAEYLVSKSREPEPGKDDTILKKSTHLTKEEYDQFINLAESPQFLKSATAYDSKISFVDSVFFHTVRYKNKGRLKEISLKNYVPSAQRSTTDPPDELWQLVELAQKLSDKIRTSGT